MLVKAFKETRYSWTLWLSLLVLDCSTNSLDCRTWQSNVWTRKLNVLRFYSCLRLSNDYLLTNRFSVDLPLLCWAYHSPISLPRRPAGGRFLSGCSLDSFRLSSLSLRRLALCLYVEWPERLEFPFQLLINLLNITLSCKYL